MGPALSADEFLEETSVTVWVLVFREDTIRDCIRDVVGVFLGVRDTTHVPYMVPSETNACPNREYKQALHRNRACPCVITLVIITEGTT